MEVQPFRSRSRSRSRPPSRSSSRKPSLSRTHSANSLTKLSVATAGGSNSSSNPAVSSAIAGDLEVPNTFGTLDNTLPLDFFKQDILALTKKLYIKKWWKKLLAPEEMTITRLSGALTNSIYKIEYPGLPSLLLRVYGKNVDSLIDREAELNVLLKLSSKNIGPKLLGTFTNGRFEQFLEGFLPLNRHSIRDEVISQMLARRMKDLHYKIELDEKDINYDDVSMSIIPVCWKLIKKWLKIFKTEYLPIYEKLNYNLNDVFCMDFADFEDLVSSYYEWVLAKYDNDSTNLKFCHNDTQYGNLLLNKLFDPKDIVIHDNVIKTTSKAYDNNLAVIDFEYSGPNFPAFDVVNHFSEWMSDYHHETKPYYIFEENYPTQLEMMNFIKSYIEHEFVFPSSKLKVPGPSSLRSTDLIQYEMKKLYNECIYWRSAVQIFWFLWGLIQNGLPKPSNPSSPGRSTKEAGVDGVEYTITTGMEHLDLNGVAPAASDDDDDDVNSGDDFDYLKYSGQKMRVILGDLIQLGVIKKSDIDEKHWDQIKWLNVQEFDLTA